MTKNQLCNFHNNIYKKYCKQMWIHSGSEEGRFYSYVIEKEVVIPPSTWSNPTEWSIFALLHEIGHVLTNTRGMKRCEEEFYATQWAIEEAKKIGFPVKQLYLDTYQDYIWNWRDSAIKRKAKQIPSKTQLKLCY